MRQSRAKGFTSLPLPATCCDCAHLWLVRRREHGHLDVLSADRFGLASGRRPGRLLVVAAHTNEEEEQGNGQWDGHTGNQDVEDLHVARLVLMVYSGGGEANRKKLLYDCSKVGKKRHFRAKAERKPSITFTK